MAVLFTSPIIIILLFGFCMCKAEQKYEVGFRARFDEIVLNNHPKTSCKCFQQENGHLNGSMGIHGEREQTHKLTCLCDPTEHQKYQKRINGGSRVPKNATILKSVFRINNGCTAAFTFKTNFLVTAAHCTLYHRFEKGNVLNIDNGYTSHQVTIKQTYVNRNYQHVDKKGEVFFNFTHDVSVLELDKEYPFAEPLQISYSAMPNGTEFFIFGYGPINERHTPTKFLKRLKMSIKRDGIPGDVQEGVGSRGMVCPGDSGAAVLSYPKREYFALLSGGESLIHPGNNDFCDFNGISELAPFYPNRNFFNAIFKPKDEAHLFSYIG